MNHMRNKVYRNTAKVIEFACIDAISAGSLTVKYYQ